MLVSLFRCLVVHSDRERGNGQAERQTDLQTKYHISRCAYGPRVNNGKN